VSWNTSINGYTVPLPLPLRDSVTLRRRGGIFRYIVVHAGGNGVHYTFVADTGMFTDRRDRFHVVTIKLEP